MKLMDLINEIEQKGFKHNKVIAGYIIDNLNYELKSMDDLRMIERASDELSVETITDKHKYRALYFLTKVNCKEI